MRSLLLVVILALAMPARAGDFVARKAKEPAAAPAPATKAAQRRAKPVRKAVRKPKKKKGSNDAPVIILDDDWKRPMP